MADSYNSAGQNLSIPEKMKHAISWKETLFDDIPIDRLPDTFREAKRLRKEAARRGDEINPFPINAFELLGVWAKLELAEELEEARRQEEIKAANRTKLCPDRAHHKSEDEPMQEYRVGDNEYRYLPCATCRYNAHWQRVGDLKAMLPDPMQNESTALAKLDKLGGLKIVK